MADVEIMTDLLGHAVSLRIAPRANLEPHYKPVALCHNGDSTALGMAADPKTTGERFERLVGIMARLRAPGGCPWDHQQTFDTIKPYLLEETYEVLDAIDRRDWPGLADELGDLLLQAVFFAQMASEENKFKI